MSTGRNVKPPGESALDTDSGVPIEGKDPGSGLSEFTSSRDWAIRRPPLFAGGSLSSSSNFRFTEPKELGRIATGLRLLVQNAFRVGLGERLVFHIEIDGEKHCLVVKLRVGEGEEHNGGPHGNDTWSGSSIRTDLLPSSLFDEGSTVRSSQD